MLPSLWKAGWLLLQKEDMDAAIRTWQAMETFKPASPWSEKALYWRGKALERGGKADLAEETFRRLRQEFPAAYHTRLAIGSGRIPSSHKGFSPMQDVSPALTPEAIGPPGEARSLRLEKRETFEPPESFCGGPGRARSHGKERGRGGGDAPGGFQTLFREIGEYHRSNLLVRRNFALRPLAASLSPRDHSLYLLAYPLGNPLWINKYAESRNLDPALLCAVILEESRFDSQALSVAGAPGFDADHAGNGKRYRQKPRRSAVWGSDALRSRN